MTLDRFEWGTGRIRVELEVSRDDPDLAVMLHPDLRRAKNVTRWVKRDADAIVVDGFAVGQGVDYRVAAEPRLKNGASRFGTKVERRTNVGMIPVRVRDDRAFHRLPRVDVEVARRAVQTAIRRNDEGVGHDEL